MSLPIIGHIDGGEEETMAGQSPRSRIKNPRTIRKSNLNRLYSAMNRIKKDAVDREIIKRFKTIIDSMNFDLTKSDSDQVLKNPSGIDTSHYPEIIHPYLRHFAYMSKRNDREK